MGTRLTDAADEVLRLAVDRALDLIRRGEVDAAERALTLGADTANLVDVAERARIVGTERAK